MTIIEEGVTGPRLREEMEAIRERLNPHPAGQKTLNVPAHGGRPVSLRSLTVDTKHGCTYSSCGVVPTGKGVLN